ncbi:hypothetical protein F5Y12DRAFT_483794 [Xylaria sp. FL1777]|nr:hypothetical protein F5Y12DRAFT_483794 [Xylaria sp. FL1777]
MAWLISVAARSRLACLTVLAVNLQPGFFVPVFPSGSRAHRFSIHPSLPSCLRAATLFNSPSLRLFQILSLPVPIRASSPLRSVFFSLTRGSFGDRLPGLIVCLETRVPPPPPPDLCRLLRSSLCFFICALFAATSSSSCIRHSLPGSRWKTVRDPPLTALMISRLRANARLLTAAARLKRTPTLRMKSGLRNIKKTPYIVRCSSTNVRRQR